jgi:nitrogen fixation NifU-like protein
MYSLYSKKVLEHFKNPKNLGVIKDADGIGTVGNPRCGDIMKVYIKVKRQKSPRAYSGQAKGKNIEIIDDIKVETLGCGAAIATSSMATELVKGKTLKEAEKLSAQAVAEALQGLPPAKMHCSNLAAEGIKRAIANYRKKM